MFTLEDIKNIAIQIEKNGENTYRRASKKATNPEMAKTFDWMADQEKNHREWFASLRAKKILTQEQKELEAMGKSLLQEMVRDNPFLLKDSELEPLDAVDEVLQRSRQFEEDTIVFYQFLYEFLDEQDAKEQMQCIIEEEKGHIRNIDLLIDSVTVSN